MICSILILTRTQYYQVDSLVCLRCLFKVLVFSLVMKLLLQINLATACIRILDLEEFAPFNSKDDTVVGKQKVYV